jgi:hypothetical protein
MTDPPAGPAPIAGYEPDQPVISDLSFAITGPERIELRNAWRRAS